MLVLDLAMLGIRDLLPYEYLSLSYHNHTISLLLFLNTFLFGFFNVCCYMTEKASVPVICKIVRMWSFKIYLHSSLKLISTHQFINYSLIPDDVCYLEIKTAIILNA